MFSHDTLTLNRPTAVLTERDVAVNAVYKLLAALWELPDDDRRDIRELLDVELEHNGLVLEYPSLAASLARDPDLGEDLG